MNRLLSTVLAGGAIAAVFGVVMSRRRNVGTFQKILNRPLNGMINVMGSLGAFRLFGRSRMFRNMVRAR